MGKLRICEYPDPALRVRCSEVERVDSELLSLLSDMAETMYAARGIGLAAPQVAYDRRVAVVDVGEGRLYKLINPVIVEREGCVDSEEGCLSFPSERNTVKRSSRVFLRALNEDERELEIEADSLFAICLQHELDHLDGKLMIDNLSRLKKKLLDSRMAKRKATRKV